MTHPVDWPRWLAGPAARTPVGRATLAWDSLRESARLHPAGVLAVGIGLGFVLGRVLPRRHPPTTQSGADGTGTDRGNREHQTDHDEKETAMGMADKITHKAEEMTGKAKEALGKAANNEDLQAEGQADQAEAQVHQAGDKLADAKDAAGDGVRRAAHDVADAVDRVTPSRES